MAAKKPARKRHDWEAIERDYRTGHFTLKELQAKHGPGFADISRRAKKEGWTKDLQSVVRQATSAAVIAETTKAIANGIANANAQNTKDVVLVAAELNKQVILRHRGDIIDTRNLAADLLAEIREATHKQGEIAELFEKITEDISGPALAAAQQQFREFMRVHSRVGSVQKLADTLTKLQTLERKAFNLDDDGAKPGELIERVERAIVDPKD